MNPWEVLWFIVGWGSVVAVLFIILVLLVSFMVAVSRLLFGRSSRRG